MNRTLLAAMVACVISGSALAEVEFQYAEVLDTRFGELHVEGADFGLSLWRGTEPLPLPEDGRWWIDWSIPGTGDYDWVIASHHHGGNSCGGATYILRVMEEGTAISRPIDGCNGRFTDIRTGEGWIEIDRTDFDIFVTHVTIRWHGDAYTETTHFAAPQPPAGAGADVQRWIGQSPYLIFEDATERARLADVMEPWQMQDVHNRIMVASEMTQTGDWVVGTGCMAHACGLEMGAIGLRISDGAVAAEIRSDGAAPRQLGLAADPAFQAAVAEGLE